MSRLVKIAIIIAIAALVVAAKQILPLYSSDPHAPIAAAQSLSPHEMMRRAGPLPHTIVDSYY